MIRQSIRKTSESIQSIERFNLDSYENHLIEIFQIFSNSSFFDEKQTKIFQSFLANLEQLDLMKDFIFIFQHHLSLMNINTNNFNILTTQLIKIEEVLISNPRSYLSNILFNFSVIIEQLKINSLIISD